jgi:Zn-dependent peptidase ImmA (M78 family)/transcriptional regulator with XRE-family HTH domain
MDPKQAIAINTRRIRSARGMSMVDVAQAAGITRQALSSIEKGLTLNPRVGNLQAIAQVLEVPIIDLLAVPPALNTVRFRSNSIKTAKDEARKQQYLIDSAFWLSNFNSLQELLDDKKQYKLSGVSDMLDGPKEGRPVMAAQYARKALGLKEDEPIGDIVGLMENAGIKIKASEFILKKFFGFSVAAADGGPAIVVNASKDITVERMIFTVAHELGHLLLHPQAYTPSKSTENDLEEEQANCFAGHFLMPQSAFNKKMNESYGLGFIDKIMHIKRFFGVSYQTVLRRWIEMEVAEPKDLYMKFNRLYQNRFGKSLKRTEEPAGLEEFDFVEDYLRLLIRKALDNELITVSRAAEILNVSLEEMRQIINSWADVAA